MHWIKKHTKLLSMLGGIVFLLISLALFFWNKDSGISVEEARAQANLARMEARTSGAASTRSADSHQKAMEAFYESRQEQLQYLLIFMMLTGVGLIGYSLLKKEPKD